MKKGKKIFDRNNLKFIFEDMKFETEIETGAITCTIKGEFESNWPMSVVSKRVFANSQLETVGYEKRRNIVYGLNTFKATVNANKTDKYSEEIGKRIAESKCKAKIYIKAMKLISDMAEESEKEIHNLKNLGARYLGYFAKEKMHQMEVDLLHNGKNSK